MLEINFSHFPVISTSRLILRRIAKADAGDFFRLRSDKNIMQHIGRPIALNIDDAVQLIEVIEDQFQNNSGITWGITMKEEKKIIGTIGLWRIIKEHHRAEIGYLLGTSFQGRGLMQEAIEPVIEYGFKKIKLHTIEANVSPLNTASIKLLEKNNFIREAHFKENYFFDGKFLDSFVYSLITPYKN